jgi:DNA-binding NtrC family response regulator
MFALRLLVVTRESAVLRPLWSVGESNSWQIESATDGWGAMERVQSGTTPDLLILDLPRSDSDGLHFLRWLCRLRPELPVIVLCDRDDSPTPREALRLGAREYILKPVEDHALENAIRTQVSKRSENVGAEITSDDMVAFGSDSFFVGASPVMRKLRVQAELLAQSDSPVLILGETGSGKETAARLIHQLSVRSGFKFTKINCAALPSDLLEAELFGYEGNGTNPVRPKAGKLELCENGTILLDEVPEMPRSLQAKLLQVLQSGKFSRPGSRTTVAVDVRILTASTSNLESAISSRKLRDDLYYRLSGHILHVPPLRERREELPLLLHHFMRYMAKRYALSPRTFSPAVLEACQLHGWPGNLQELENFVKRFLLAGSKELPFANGADLQHSAKSAMPFFEAESAARPPQMEIVARSSDSLKSLVQAVKLEAEKSAIIAALQKTGWNRKAAARLLKVSYRTLLYKIDQYRLKPAESTLMPEGAGLRNRGREFPGDGRPR